MQSDSEYRMLWESRTLHVRIPPLCLWFRLMSNTSLTVRQGSASTSQWQRFANSKPVVHWMIASLQCQVIMRYRILAKIDHTCIENFDQVLSTKDALTLALLTDGIGETPADMAPSFTRNQDPQISTTNRPQASGTIDSMVQETGSQVGSISNHP
jgi:hypothetical protein